MVDITGPRPVSVTDGLTGPDFSRIAGQGFGDPTNSYVHCLAGYRGFVFAGTSRNSMALLKLFPPPEPPALDPWPVWVPDDVADLDMHGQIWRLDAHRDGRPAGRTLGRRWRLVHTSPDILGKDGSLVPRDLGYRGMTVFRGASDPVPALYVGSISTVLRGCAARLLRSTDGESFDPVGEPGLGNPQVSTLRAMTGFDDHLWVPPAGQGITLNSNSASMIMRSDDPAAGPWQEACEPGFGDATNTGVFELCTFAGHLYAGTFNAEHGYQIWKTPATGRHQPRWTRVVADGAGRGPHNEIAMSMCVFGDALYVGSGIQNGGYDRVSRIGPAASELIRIHPDDRWELIIGEARQTKGGWKEPLSGIGPGFGNPFAGYFWRMATHDGWLYLSTFDWTVFLPWAGKPSKAAEAVIDAVGAPEAVRRAGGFELWRTRNGTDWFPVTINGFGNPYNYGGRTLLSTPHGLLVGTANPFAPEAPGMTAHGWRYAPNPDGGSEVWLGASCSSTRTIGSRRVARATVGTEVLITGATGFLGSRLADELSRRGVRLRILAQPGTEEAARRESTDVVVGALDDRAAVERAVRGSEIVVHLAGVLPGADPEELHRINIEGTDRLLSVCRDDPPRRFVLMSSTAVYADTLDRSRWPLTEASAVGPTGPGPAVAYGWSKVAAERLLHRRAVEGGFERLVLRPATCYGSGSDSAERLIKAAQAGPLLPRSSRVVQYLHVDDLAAMVAILIWSAADQDTVHLAGPDSLSWSAVQELVRRTTGHGVLRGRVADRQPLPLARFEFPYDLTHARELGAVPRIGLREGLTEAARQLRGAKVSRSPSAGTGGRHRRAGYAERRTGREVEWPWMSR